MLLRIVDKCGAVHKVVFGSFYVYLCYEMAILGKFYKNGEESYHKDHFLGFKGHFLGFRNFHDVKGDIFLVVPITNLKLRMILLGEMCKIFAETCILNARNVLLIFELLRFLRNVGLSTKLDVTVFRSSVTMT